jgi:SpoVK/Ycf46/Vps4 family AAA+-type ATPase
LQTLSSSPDMQATWSDLHLPEVTLLRIVELTQAFAGDDPAAPRGLLLFGPPGTGKTLIARKIAQTVRCPFIPVAIPDLKAGYIGQSGQRVRALWEQARSSGKAVLFVDECEGVFGRRGALETDSFVTELVQAFLAEWDGVHSHGTVWVIGATNRRDLIDDAIFSRFGEELEIGLPDESARVRILQSELAKVGINVEIPGEIAAQTIGFSGRDLANLARRIKLEASPNGARAEHFFACVQAMRVRGSTSIDEMASWDSLALDDNTLRLLRNASNQLKHAETLNKQGFPSPRGIVLYGPPGTGKTQAARTLARETGLRFIATSTADLKAGFIGQSGQRVREAFEKARVNAPAILFIDEIDIIAPVRNRVLSDSFTSEIIGQLLQEMDGIKSSPVFVLAATNHLTAVDEAVLSRFPLKIEISLPDVTNRLKILGRLLKGKRTNFDNTFVHELAARTEGSSGRELRDCVEHAFQNAISRALEAGTPESVELLAEDFSLFPQSQASSTHGS